MAYYVVHPGNVTLQKTGQVVYVDAGTLASYYGLQAGEYLVDTPSEAIDKGQHIHLYPRPDNKYKNIKNLEGDTPNGVPFYDRPAFWKKHHRGF